MSEQQEPSDDHPLRRVTARNFESLVDQQIRAAEAAGQFRDLPGAGKPLDLGDDKDIPEELRAGFRILKNAGVAPAWIELQKRVREEQEALERWLERCNRRWPNLGPTDRAALRAEHDEKIGDLNKLITVYNLTAPPVAGQLPLLVLAQERGRLGA